jgi:hypothetical protein
MAEFKVVIDGADLSEQKRQAISADIQRAVLPHLADLGSENTPVVVIPDRRHWRGFVIRPVAIEDLGENVMAGFEQ